ncbi:MAG: polysaccharide biosynthesis/export family protein [Hyphomonadaceae bacterium]|jgi:polysaccharide export outer membrane protein
MNLVFWMLRASALAVAALAITACATEPLPVGTGDFAVETGHEYKLGPGDRVRVNVYGEETLSGEFLVSNRGSVALPLVGDVKAGGLSVEGLEQSVQEKLVATDMVRTPRVAIDVVSYRPFYILGEIDKPGQYPYAIGMTVTKAVATAGGFTYRANSRVVYVTREGAANETPLTVTAATWIGPGDTVRVGERTF